MALPKPDLPAPIPGANYTADTRNYPWHRPPKNQDFVSTVEHFMGKLGTPKGTGFVLTALQEGDTIFGIVTGITRLSVANGNSSIDNAILAAGPIARAIEELAIEAGIDYERGFSEREDILTPERVQLEREMPPEDEMMEEADEAEEEMGLMSPTEDVAPPEVQSEMLGGGEEEMPL